MTPLERMKFALLRAQIELQYCHERMGTDRSFTRADTLASVADGLRATDEMDPTIIREAR